MIGGPSGLRWLDTFEPQLGKIERIDKRVDRPNGTIPIDPVFQIFGKKRGLAPIHSFNESLHSVISRIPHGNHIARVRSSRFYTARVILGPNDARNLGPL